MGSFFSGLLADIVGSVVPGGSSTIGVIAEGLFMLSDYRMWRSLGWLLLGILLIILGVVVWNRHAIEGVAGAAALAA